MAARGVRWWPKGVLFGALCGALWVPVQLGQSPEPELFGSVLVGLIIASMAMIFFGRFFPRLLPRKSPRARLLLLGAILILLVYGGMAFLLTRDVTLSLRVAAPRAMYFLVLGLILLQLVKTEEVRHSGETNSMSE
jgi:hypothetical protein